MALTTTIAGAMLPGERAPGQDRWTATGSAVVVLDGATAVDPAVPPADAYATELCSALATSLADGADSRCALRGSISTVARQLGLTVGHGPSSTVVILRVVGDVIEIAVLGDSTALVGLRSGRVERITDDRLARIAPDLREQYRRRLLAGHGFDSTHRALLREIQQAEVAARNRPDGAQRPYDHLHATWSTLPADAGHLRRCLEQLHNWEANDDPDGRLLPRSKRHDDKTLVIWRP